MKKRNYTELDGFVLVDLKRENGTDPDFMGTGKACHGVLKKSQSLKQFLKEEDARKRKTI